MMPAWLTTPLSKFLLVAAVLGGAAWGITAGVSAIDTNGYRRAESKYQLQIVTADKTRVEQARLADAEAARKRDGEARNILRLSEQLITAKTVIDTQTKQLQERAHDVSTQYRPQPDAALMPVPDWIVTRGWLCDYNRAIGYSEPGAGAAVGGDAATACAADAFGPSGVSAERILSHHEQYGGYCRKLEQQVNVLLDHIEFVEKDAGK
jgi:hypothetical protein